MHAKEARGFRSVGRLFYEPIWVFTSGDLPIASLRDLVNRRILVGGAQTATRRIALQLLKANGIDASNAKLLEGLLSGNGAELEDGSADAAILILPSDSGRVQDLLRVPTIRLMDFSSEADTYTNRFPALAKVVLHKGSIEMVPVIPSADISLLATSAALAVRSDMQPALVSRLSYAVVHNPKHSFDKSGDPVLFYRAGKLPSISDPEFQVAQEARPIYQSGELPFVLRFLAPINARVGLPFSVTAFVSRILQACFCSSRC